MREGLGEGGTWQSIWDFQIYAASASPLSTLTLLLTLPFLSQVKFDGVPKGTAAPAPPYRITFPASGPTPLPAALSALSRVDGSSVAAAPPNTAAPAAADSGTTDAAAGSGAATPVPRGVLSVEAYRPQDPGPYPQNQPPQNKVRFTPVQVRVVGCKWGRGGNCGYILYNMREITSLPHMAARILASCSLFSICFCLYPPPAPPVSYAQVEAVMAGVQPGLTMVVGPPGTGKTDTAVQVWIISCVDGWFIATPPLPVHSTDVFSLCLSCFLACLLPYAHPPSPPLPPDHECSVPQLPWPAHPAHHALEPGSE